MLEAPAADGQVPGDVIDETFRQYCMEEGDGAGQAHTFVQLCKAMVRKLTETEEAFRSWPNFPATASRAWLATIYIYMGDR